MAYASLEPWWSRQDHRALAHVAAVVASSVGGRRVNPELLMPWIVDAPALLGADIELTDDEHASALDRLLFGS